MRDFAGALINEVYGKGSKSQALETEREKWASDPAHVMKLLSHIQRQWVPDEKAKKLGVGAPLEKVEASLSDDDPRKGLSGEVMNEFIKVLPHAPKDWHPYEVAHAIYSKKLNDLAPKVFDYARQQDTNWGVGIGGDKYKLGHLQPYYDEWRKQDNAEKGSGPLNVVDYSKTDTHEVAGATAIGGIAGLIGGAGKALFGNSISKALAKPGAGKVASWIAKAAVPRIVGASLVGGPVGTAIGVGVTAAQLAVEFGLWDVASQAAKRSEWFRARDTSSLMPNGITEPWNLEVLGDKNWLKTVGMDLAIGQGVISGTKSLARQAGRGIALETMQTGAVSKHLMELGSLDNVLAKVAIDPSASNLMRAAEAKNSVDVAARESRYLKDVGTQDSLIQLADFAGDMSKADFGGVEGSLGRVAKPEGEYAKEVLDILSTGKKTGMDTHQSVAMLTEQARREYGGIPAELDKKINQKNNVKLKTSVESLKDVQDLDAVTERINKGQPFETAIQEQKLAESTLGEYYPDTGFGGPEIAKSNKQKMFEREQSKVARGRTLMDLEVKASEPAELKAPAPGETAAKVEDIVTKDTPILSRSHLQNDRIVLSFDDAGKIPSKEELQAMYPGAEVVQMQKGLVSATQGVTTFHINVFEPGTARLSPARAKELYEKTTGGLPGNFRVDSALERSMPLEQRFGTVVDTVIKRTAGIKPTAPASEDHATKLFNAAIKSPENEVKATNIVSDILANPAHPDRSVAESYLMKMKAHKETVAKNEALKTAARDADRAATTKIEGDAEEIGNLVNSKDINFFGEAEVVAPESVVGKTVKGPSYADELNVFIKNRKAITEALKKGGKTIAGVGAVGLALQPGAMGAGTYVNLVKQGLTMDNVSDIDPGAAQAAGIADRQVGKLVTGIFKDVYKNTSDMFTAMKDAHLLAPKIDPANKYVIGDAATGDIQRGVTIVPDPNPRNMITRRKRLPLVFDMLMSPGAKGQIYYGVTNNGREMLNNPIVSAASHHTAALNNTEHMFEVVRNILGEVPGITKDSTMIAAEMKDLNKEYIGKYTTEGYSRFKVEEQAGIIKRAEKDLRKKNLSAEDRTVIQDTLTEAQIQQKIHTDMLKEGEGFWPDFKQRWEQKMQNLTDRSSSSRIALAAEDTANFDHYPWLKGKMTQEELVAAGRIKKVMEQISGYMSEQKMPVISERPYFHHAAHPETNYSELKSILDKFATEGGDEAMRLSKTHARAMNSLQMMPDVFYALDKYLPDINRRIQWNDFWKPGEKNGWAAHANSQFVQDSEGLKKFWDGFKRGFDPVDLTTTDKWARRMYAFEVARLLSFSPSVALKHAIKLEANWSNFGIKESASVLPKSIDLLRRMRFTKDVPQDMETTAARSFTNQGRLYQQAVDFDTYEVPQSFWDKAIEKWNDKGSILLDTTERFDRGHSFLAASEMAMKQGMTPAQAAYSIYDTILKTNFLSGPMNPSWLRDPKIRMMMMFQGTPFKILEQRAIQAYRAGRGVKDHYETLQALKSDIKEGEFKFKAGMIMDALKREKDIYGTPIAQQLMRKMLIMGTVVMGGKMAFDADLWSHFSHPPFFKAQQSEFGVAAMPVAQAAHQAYGKERGEDDYFVSDFFNAWLKDGLLQSQFIKANRLSKDDIPERYKGSGLKYVFGIPAVADKTKQ